MDFGLCLPNYPAGATREGIDAAADAAARLGFSTVWTTDHVLVDHTAADEYGRIYEAILTLAWVGATNPDVRLGTSVIVVPQRNAILLAKELATLDSLSDGRVVAGIGIGWSRPEYTNLAVADRFAVRGAYLDETIRLWRHLWSGSREPFHGRFHRLDDFEFEPLPTQGADLPILVGGRADAALHRAGSLADGYHSSAIGPGPFGHRVAIVRAAAEAAGRPAPRLTARVRVQFEAATDPDYAIRGTPEEMAHEIRAFQAHGASHLALHLMSTDPVEVVARMERFSREVMPIVGD